MFDFRRAGFLGILCAFFILAVGLVWPYTMDDAYISLRYADHLSRGLGLTWNPGGQPVEGFSNFLWVLWMAGATLLPGDPMTWSKAFGAVLGLATILLLASEGREMISGSLWGLFPAACLAFSPMFAFWSSSGIEMPAFTLALLAGWRGLRRAEPILAGIALAAAALLRPEGLFLAAVCGGIFLFAGFARRRRDEVRCVVVAGGVVACAVAPYLLWRLLRFGDLLANTVHAKWLPLGGFRYFILDFAYFQFGHLFLASAGLFLVVSGRIPNATLNVSKRTAAPPPAVALAAATAMLAAQAAMLANARPVMGFYLRLFWPVIPFLYLLSGLAIHAVSRAMRPEWIVVLPATLFAVFPAVRDLSPLRLPGAPTSAPVRNTAIAVGQILSTVHAPLARWIRQSHPGATVALTDCGLLPYVSDARIFDLWGLNDPEIARQGFDPERLLAHRPDLLVLASRDESRFLARFPMDGQLQAHPTVARDYRHVRTFTWRNFLDGSGDYSLWVYERLS